MKFRTALGREMAEWGEKGLIPHVDATDLVEDVAADILKVVRKHIEDHVTPTDEAQ